MLLFKCNCGSSYTVREDSIKTGKWIHCPQCDQSTYVTGNAFELMNASIEKGTDVQRIPDTAKITVTFNI